MCWEKSRKRLFFLWDEYVRAKMAYVDAKSIELIKNKVIIKIDNIAGKKRMKDYSHIISVEAVKKLDKDKEYSDSEKTVITYGIELFLNTALKMLIYIAIGIMVDKAVETLVSIITFEVLRFYSGGIHAKTDTGCFILSGGIVFGAVLLAEIFIVPSKIYFALGIVLNIIYWFFADKAGKREKANERLALKVKAVIAVNVFLGIGFKMNAYWATILMAVTLLQGLTLIPNKRAGGMCNEKRT